jgi:protocatechuate 3,4-dioxygenase beta subunit
MLDDDEMRGRLLSRKEALATMAGAGAFLLAGTRTSRAVEPAKRICVALPAMTEGPFFVDDRLERSDIRVEPEGGDVTPGAILELRLNVSQLAGDSCTPFPGAMVDLWHCNAAGAYSGAKDSRHDYTDKRFLRGYQFTDANGEVRFTTIYPGWYPGRAVHIHFKIQSPEADGKRLDFTSQLFFDDTFSAKVFAQPPYAVHGPHDRKNGDDGIFQRGGDQLILDVAEKEGKFSAEFDIAVKVDAA